MSCSKWKYDPEICDGQPCPGDCDLCHAATKIAKAARDIGVSMEQAGKRLQKTRARHKQSTYGTCMDGSQDEF